MENSKDDARYIVKYKINNEAYTKRFNHLKQAEAFSKMSNGTIYKETKNVRRDNNSSK